jgi:hypothetical protein
MAHTATFRSLPKCRREGIAAWRYELPLNHQVGVTPRATEPAENYTYLPQSMTFYSVHRGRSTAAGMGAQPSVGDEYG